VQSLIDDVRTVAQRLDGLSDARIERLGHFLDDAKRFRKSLAGCSHNITKVSAGHFRFGRNFSADIPFNVTMGCQLSIVYWQGIYGRAQFVPQVLKIATQRFIVETKPRGVLHHAKGFPRAVQIGVKNSKRCGHAAIVALRCLVGRDG
jgi:hypothetical protein